MQALLLIGGITIDSFIVCFSYGTNKIRISTGTILLINIISSAIFAIAMLLGRVVSGFFSSQTAYVLSFLTLFIMGVIRFCPPVFNAWLQRWVKEGKTIKVKAFDLKFMIEICLDNTKADKDNSKDISLNEAIYLSLVLSIDSIIAGLGAGINNKATLLYVLLLFLIGTGLSFCGLLLGKRLAHTLKYNIAWVGGLLLMVAAVVRLF